jgi:hypothetical protein
MIFGILASLIQVVVYYFLIFILWNVGKKFHMPTKTDFTWGLTILYSTYIFGIITVIQNSLIEILYKKKSSDLFFYGSFNIICFNCSKFRFFGIKNFNNNYFWAYSFINKILFRPQNR